MPENSKRKVAIATLGCKVNQFESASFLSDFEAEGLEQVDFSTPADIYVINTCAVTAKAAAQSRQLIRRALNSTPAGQPPPRVVVTGCYAQVARQEILKIDSDAIRIVSNADKDKVSTTAMDVADNIIQPPFRDIGHEKEICHLPVRNFGNRTRAFLRVQDGCNNFCSYCIVPYARGRSRSLPPQKVLAQAKTFADQGYRELVITGIHVGAYGNDLVPPVNLLVLLQKLADALPDVRLRISSLEPTEISTELLHFMAMTANCMDHLHIPLQSGDDAVLKNMRRRYSGKDFSGIVKAIHDHLPGAALGVDVLVGFPGEDDEAFSNTKKLLEDLPVTYLHVFPYSRRPGTPAASMAGQVPKTIKDERVSVLRSLNQRKRTAFYSSHLGQTGRVLTESSTKRPGQLRGFTENYIPVIFKGPSSLANQVVTVRLKKVTGDGVQATLVESQSTCYV